MEELSFGDMSLHSFTSESSFTSLNSSAEQNGSVIANLIFVTDSEMATIMNGNKDYEKGVDDNIMDFSESLPPSAILGTGSFSTVRLAWRKEAPTLAVAEQNCHNPDKAQRTKRQRRRSIIRVASQDSNLSLLDDKGQLVAVKMIQKSILKQMKIMQKGSNNLLTVKTAFDDIEKEIATMKRLQHPNCVQLYDVIDSVESNTLYMVLEYVSLGEILSNVDGTDRYRKRGQILKVKGLTPEGYYDEQNAALYFVDILHGLAYLHRHSICHRDLKPEK
jgi:serine/threonine protein kinase